MLLPIAAQFARTATEARARSALPESPVTGDSVERHATMPGGRRRLAAVLRRTADRLEPVAG
jgi:hypothetical protein